jgi:hypothetical protein
MNGIIRLSVVFIFTLLSSGTFSKELPVESFSQLPSFIRPNLSPSGNKIAYIRNHQSPEISVLTSVDLLTGKKQYIIKSDNEARKKEKYAGLLGLMKKHY